MAWGCDTMSRINFYRLGLLLNNEYCTISFLGRYLTQDNPSSNKSLLESEVKLLSSHNIDIVSLMQKETEDINHFTAANGLADAYTAVEAAAALGQPNGTPIYFCVDCDPSDDEITDKVLPYFNRANMLLSVSVFNPNGYLLGAYGNSRVLKKIKAN